MISAAILIAALVAVGVFMDTFRAHVSMHLCHLMNFIPIIRGGDKTS